MLCGLFDGMRGKFMNWEIMPMNLSLEKINKFLLYIALIALIYRKGNFYNSFIPKPFEILFVLLALTTGIYLIKERKLKDFFYFIPKNIRIALLCLGGSIIAGWGIAAFFKGIPTNLNTLLEFGTFAIGITTFLLVLFYTKNDAGYHKKYFYALLFPAVYVLFFLLPEMKSSVYFDAAGRFMGLTINPNIISKTLLIPSLFFISYALFELKNKWFKIGFISMAAGIVGLLFWISSRGALLSLLVGSVVILVVFLQHEFTWKKLCYSGLILLLIFSIGFTITPYDRKQVTLNRVLNSDTALPRSKPVSKA